MNLRPVLYPDATLYLAQPTAEETSAFTLKDDKHTKDKLPNPILTDFASPCPVKRENLEPIKRKTLFSAGQPDQGAARIFEDPIYPVEGICQ